MGRARAIVLACVCMSKRLMAHPRVIVCFPMDGSVI